MRLKNRMDALENKVAPKLHGQDLLNACWEKLLRMHPHLLALALNEQEAKDCGVQLEGKQYAKD